MTSLISRADAVKIAENWAAVEHDMKDVARKAGDRSDTERHLYAADMAKTIASALSALPSVESPSPSRREGLLEAAEICRQEAEAFASPEYATGQPLSSLRERIACGACAESILSRANTLGESDGVLAPLTLGATECLCSEDIRGCTKFGCPRLPAPPSQEGKS